MRRIWCQLGTQVKLSILPFSTARHLGHGTVWLGTVFWPQAARVGPLRRLLRAAYERTSHPSATDSDVRVALYKIHRAIRAGLARFIREGAKSGLWGGEIVSKRMA